MTRASFIIRILFATLYLVSHSSCDRENVDILKTYEEYFNRDNTNFTYEDGILYNVERADTSRYKIEITIKVKEKANPKAFRLLKCTATLLDNAGTLTVEENQCDDGNSTGRSSNEPADLSSELEDSQDETTELSITETDLGRQAINLDSEVQSDNAQINSSGEQFFAIPRPQPSSSPCIGCSSLVDNNAPGVEALANLAVRHINKHTPDFAYKLKSILQVERQVQVVNGVRYLLTIDISDSSCVETQAKDCPAVKTCKMSILEKPWLKIPNGKKFRAILSNNCTEQWLFGDDGEELLVKDDDITNSDDEVIKVIKNVDVQASPNFERKLTGEELKELEEQIIPTNEIGRQKRDAKLETGEVVLEPKSLYLQNLAIEAFEKYSLEKSIRFRVVYATWQLGLHVETTRIDFNVRVQPSREDEKKYENMRCHSRVSENDVKKKSFYTYCIHIDALNSVIEMPASNPIFRPVAQAKLRSEYGNLLQFYEVIRVYVNAGVNKMQNIIFDAKSSVSNVYRCYLISHENADTPLVCKMQEPENSPVRKIEKDPTATKYLHLAMVALSKYLIHSNITEQYIIAAVTHASELDGPLTNIDIDFIAVDFDSTLRCISNIMEKNEAHILKISVICSTIPERKDYPTGVIIERNPRDANYIKIAKTALEKHYSHIIHKDLRVAYVNEQLLDTLIMRIDVDINMKNSTSFRCHLKLFQNLLKKMEDEYIDCFSKSEVSMGGRIDHNASDPRNWKIAEEALIKKYNNSLVLLDVVRFTTQVVAGVASETEFYAISPLDKIVHHCRSHKLDQPWNNVSELNVECKPKNAKPSPIPGEIIEQNPSDPKYKAIAIEALAKRYPAYSKNTLKIVYANEQLVNGVITRLDFDSWETNATIVRCHVKLYEIPGGNVRKLYIDCYPKALNLPGGLFEQNASDPKNWKYAEESLVQKFHSSLKLLDVVRVTKAAGFTTETDFYAVSHSDEVIHLCKSTKYDAPWKNVSKLNVECKPRRIKPVPSDIIEKDPSDPALIEIARLALKTKYPDINNHSLRVVYANEQFLNVLITRFDFDVINKCKMSDSRCHIKLFGKFVENERNLTLNCFSKDTDGRIELNASDPQHWQNAQESLAKEYGSSLSLLDVLRVTTRNGNSIINETDFDAISLNNNVVYRCHTTIYIKVLENFKDTELTCEPILNEHLNYKKEVKKDPSDPIYSELANKSLTHFLATTNNSKPYRVAQVLHASEYVTNGLNTEIHFIAVLSNHTDILKCFSNIWERNWLNRTVIKAICSSVLPKPRSKRMPGSKKQQDPETPIYLKLAQRSLSQYLSAENVETQYKIKVQEVTKQVVSGVSTDIYFTAISVNNSNGYKCHSNIWERGWLRSSVINVKCNPLQPLVRQKRENQLLGGRNKQDPKDPKFLPLAIKSLSQYLKGDTKSNEFQITIEEVSTQVVAGLITRMVFVAKSLDGGYKCDSEIYEVVWENITTIDVHCSPLPQQGRKKRENQLLGGRTKQDPNDPKFLPLAIKSLIQYLKGDTNSNEFKITIEEVSTQVVAGLITRMVFVAKSLDGEYKCDSEIYEVVWKNITTIKVHCSPLPQQGRKKREPGGRTKQDPKDPKFLPLARKSLSEFLKLNTARNEFQITIEEVSTQVVAGLITRMVFVAKSPDGEYRCDSEIYEVIWKNITTIDVHCSPLPQQGRKKRENQLLGGRTKQDPKDPKFLPLAIKSLSQYLKGDTKSDEFKITIKEVSTQVVAGLITRMVFVAKSPDGEYRCDSEIYEVIWKNSTTIKVHCSPLPQQGRKKREPGGRTKQDPKDPKFLPLARKSFSEYLKLNTISNDLQITIEEVSTQVVAGLITRMVFVAKSLDVAYRCDSEIYEVVWKNITTINVHCSPLPQQGRKKRENQLPGGRTKQDPNDPKYMSLARKSLNQYLQLEDTGKQFLLTVKRVNTQIVTGISTDIEFFAKSLENSVEYKCHAIIWERLWLNSTIIRVNCSSLVTSETTLDPNDKQVLGLAEESLCQYLHIDKISFEKEIKVISATLKDTSVKSLNLVFQAISKSTFGELQCQSYIWERTTKNYTVVDVKCSPSHENSRRTSRNAILNQTKTQDPSDLKYLALAKKSLSHYQNLKNPSTQYQITVEQVTTTIVSGQLTQIYFIAVEKNGFNTLRCHSKIWEQLWLNSTKFDVKCDPLPREERSIYDILPSDDHDIEKEAKHKRSIDLIKNNNDESSSSELLVDNEDNIKPDHLANEALKYIDAKYRHPRQMKVISILSFTKDPSSAHYRIKMEVGYTNCLALSPIVGKCNLVSDMGANKFCRVSLWLQPNRDHPPRFKVSCDIDENLIETNKNTQAERLFSEFIKTYKPAYLNNFNEMKRRFEIFKENIEKIHELNTHERGTARYGVTKVTDLNEEEFSTKYLGLKPQLGNGYSMTMTKAKIPNVTLPPSFDWREKGAVTEVKNQGACGSCWAFSVTGNIEGQWKLKSGKLVSLSEQELVDCDTVDHGCNGGLPDNAYRAIEQLGGLETEQDYPYEALDDKCSFNKTLSKVQINGAVNITSNETAMAMWLVEHGPISIGLNANGMQFYFGGVSHPWKVLCNPNNLDHGVLIVGFGIKDYKLFNKTLPYWIIKNSWGPSWGEQGYYRLYRGDGSCGVDQMASSAVIN